MYFVLGVQLARLTVFAVDRGLRWLKTCSARRTLQTPFERSAPGLPSLPADNAAAPATHAGLPSLPADNAATPATHAGLPSLPADIAGVILRQVSYKDRSALGATCRHLREAVFQHRSEQGELHLGVTGPAALTRFVSNAREDKLATATVYGAVLSRRQAECLASIGSLTRLTLQGHLGQDVAALAPLTGLRDLALVCACESVFVARAMAPLEHYAAGYHTPAVNVSRLPVTYYNEALAAVYTAGAWIPVWGVPWAGNLWSSSVQFQVLVHLTLEGMVRFPRGALPALRHLPLSNGCARAGHVWQVPSTTTTSISVSSAKMQMKQYVSYIEDLFSAIGHTIEGFTLRGLPMTYLGLWHVVSRVSQCILADTFMDQCYVRGNSSLTSLSLCVHGPAAADPADQLRLSFWDFPVLQRLHLTLAGVEVKPDALRLPAVTHLVLQGRGARFFFGNVFAAFNQSELPALRHLDIRQLVLPAAAEAMHTLFDCLQSLPLLESFRLTGVEGQERFLGFFVHRGQPARLVVTPGEPDSVVWTSAPP